MKKEAISALFILLCVLTACKPFPKDPNNTLEEVQNKVLKVGYRLTTARRIHPSGLLILKSL